MTTNADVVVEQRDHSFKAYREHTDADNSENKVEVFQKTVISLSYN